MFLSYLDSSGRASYQDKEDFVLASITVNEHQWYSTRNKIEKLKQKYFPDLPIEKVEIHAKDMMNRSGIYEKLTWAQIYEILDDLFEIISDDDTGITIIASLLQKSKLRKKVDLEIWAHRFVFERLNRFVNDQNELFAKAGYPHEYGIMIMDSEGHVKDQKLRDKLFGMLDSGTHYSSLNYLIEDPLFTDSKWRNLSQIADCVAYAIRKNFRNNSDSTHTTNWKRYFSMIEKKFRNVNGNYHGIGLKIFP